MKPFSVGERVRVYHRNSVFNGKIDSIKPTGEVRVIEDGFYSVHDESPFHPKQCRRLKPKKRRRVWVFFENRETALGFTYNSPESAPDWAKDSLVEFTEVKKK